VPVGENGAAPADAATGAAVAVAEGAAAEGADGTEGEAALDVSSTLEAEEREAKGDAKPERSKRRGRAQATKKKIQELLRPGQEILVQVVKDPMGTKGSRLTTQYSLAGRYLVYVPDGEGLGVSRRLEESERNRLRDIVKGFELPAGGGLIVRTAAEGALEEDITKDLQLLLKLHEQLMEKSEGQRAPKLLYNEADLSLRIIRDLFNDEVEGVIVDDERQYQRIMNYLKRTSPTLTERVQLYEGQRPLFETHGVEQAIRSTLNKRANLPGGGYLIIDYAEAFTVIDVNTGRNVGKTSLEETITKTNMEAAEEIVRQLRLRDIGGIIVVDFIDMNMMKNRDAVLEHFRKELSKDRTKTYLVEISPLGLVEMTRQNVSDGVREILTVSCAHCEGRGVVVSAETHAIDVERAIAELAEGLGEEVEAVAVDASPEVANVLAGSLGKRRELSRRAGKTVRVFGDPDVEPNSFVLRRRGPAAEIEGMAEPLLRGQQMSVTIEAVDPVNEQDGIARIGGVTITVIGAGGEVGEERTVLIAASMGDRAFATLVRPARRRRRRGGRGRRRGTGVAVGAEGETLDAGAETDDGLDDELEGDDVEDGDEIADDHPDDAGAETEVDDLRAEIPERLSRFGDDEAEGEDDLDEDEDDDDPDDDPDDDGHDDDDDGSAEGDDEPEGYAGDDDEGDDDAEDDLEDEDADAEGVYDDDDDEDEDDHDEASLDGEMAELEDDLDELRPVVNRGGARGLADVEMDVDGDDLLSARGVQAPTGASPASSSGPRSGGGSRSRGGRGGSGGGGRGDGGNGGNGGGGSGSGGSRSGGGTRSGGGRTAGPRASAGSGGADVRASVDNRSPEGGELRAGGDDATGDGGEGAASQRRRRRRGSRGGRNRRRPAGEGGAPSGEDGGDRPASVRSGGDSGGAGADE
jgi:ribonuclease G